ncbi:uncharacterized protein LOC142345126 [Convolutriloba macropyga]|uniref:uncharacterized protein LOC142345126 n=1 Tax=Convolutriloba macropyga TaxID=536237 RepID=UPI003F51AFB0
MMDLNAPGCASSLAQHDYHAMSRDEELFMRLMYLIRRTCDQLSRDLMTHVLRVIHWQSWDAFAGDPVCKQDFKKYFKNRFGDRIPSLHECDTTTLYDFFKNQATYLSIGNKRNKEFDEDMETIKKFRNDSAHETSMELSDEDYNDRLRRFVTKIGEFDPGRFPSLTKCLHFLERNKRHTFHDFCRNNPEEVELFVETLEPQLLNDAAKIPALKPIVEKIELMCCRISEIETRIDGIEKSQETTEAIELPKSVLLDIPRLAGRKNDLEKIAESFKRYQVVSICGPMGFGKTSLAIGYARQQRQLLTESKPKEENCEAENVVYLYVKMIEISTKVDDDSELKQEVGRKMGELFPAIKDTISDECDNPFAVLVSHVRDVLKHKRLFFILDNIDTVLAAQFSNAMGGILEDLTSLDERVQILTTSRDKTLYTNLLKMDTIELKPISLNDCREWMTSENSEANISEELIDAIALKSEGIPLVFRGWHRRALKRKDLTVEELNNFITGKDLNPVVESLDLSFKTLTLSQTLLMKCASVLISNFVKDLLMKMHNKLTNETDSGSLDLEDCVNLSLIELSEDVSKYFLHSCTREYIQHKLITDICERERLNAIFVVTYYQKLLEAGDSQLEKDNYLKICDEMLDDFHNYETFVNRIDGQNSSQASSFETFVKSDTEFQCLSLLNCLWFLDKIGKHKKLLPKLVKQLDSIFKAQKMHAHEVVCKCFLAHKFLLFEAGLPKARAKIQKSITLSKAVTERMRPFCLGYVHYMMGRLNKKTRTINSWKKQFPWEGDSAAKHFSIAFGHYKKWDLKSETNDCPNFKVIRLIQLCRVQFFICQEKLRSTQTMSEKEDCSNSVQQNVNTLQQLLGTHEEVAFAVKRQADYLKLLGQKKTAADKYQKAYDIYVLLGLQSRAQQISLLKDWAECFVGNNQAKKLNLAMNMLTGSYMQNHNLFGVVRASLENLREQTSN